MILMPKKNRINVRISRELNERIETLLKNEKGEKKILKYVLIEELLDEIVSMKEKTRFSGNEGASQFKAPLCHEK